MLRSSALAVAACLFVLATAAAIFFEKDAWPFVFWTGLVTLALAIERRSYGAAQRGRPGEGWQRTGEAFFDDASGHRVEVWFDPASGERRYVQVD